MSCWRDPQLQVSENDSDLTKCRSTIFKFWLIEVTFYLQRVEKLICNMLIKMWKMNIIDTGGLRVNMRGGGGVDPMLFKSWADISTMSVDPFSDHMTDTHIICMWYEIHSFLLHTYNLSDAKNFLFLALLSLRFILFFNPSSLITAKMWKYQAFRYN